jgi:ankyrin repeat protein
MNEKQYEQDPLCTAAADGNVDTLRGLLEIKGVNVDVKGFRRRTPLLWACANGNYECIKLLIEHNANVHAHDNGEYALGFLIWRPQNPQYHTELTREKLVRLLIRKGAKVNMDSHNMEDSVLWAAIRRDQIEVVSDLLHAGANPSFVAYDSAKTPLTHAIRKGKKELFDLLMRYNVDVNQGKRQRNPETMEFYPGLRSPLGIAVEYGDNKMVIDLFAKGAKMTQNEILRTALVATRANDVDGKSSYTTKEDEEMHAMFAKEWRENETKKSPQIV